MKIYSLKKVIVMKVLLRKTIKFSQKCSYSKMTTEKRNKKKSFFPIKNEILPVKGNNCKEHGEE